MAQMDIAAGKIQIDFGATGVAEIVQNIRMILTTPEFSCPLDRSFAWSPDLDAPINVVQARQSARIAEAIALYEPRAQLVSVTFQADAPNGVLKPIVRVIIEELIL